VVMPNAPQNQQNSGSRRTQPQGLIPTNAQPADSGVRPVNHQQSPDQQVPPQWNDNQYSQGNPPPPQFQVDSQRETPPAQPPVGTPPTGQQSTWQAPFEQPAAQQPPGGQPAPWEASVR